MTKWDKLIGMLEARRSTLVGFKDLVGLFREMDGAHGDMQDIEVLSRLIIYINTLGIVCKFEAFNTL